MTTFRATFCWLFTVCCLVHCTRAEDSSYENYLRQTGLTPNECMERSPYDLVGWVAEEHHLGFGGTPGYEQDVIELFYRQYASALRSLVDARYPLAKRVRVPLQELYCEIYDYLGTINHGRSYVTHERIAAWTEHTLSDVNRYAGGSMVLSQRIATRRDVATFARLKAVLWVDPSLQQGKSHDRYATRVGELLAEVERADPSLDPSSLRYAVAEFIDEYRELLNPRPPYHLISGE